MSTPSLGVIAARAQLIEAETAQREERRKQLITQLATTREQLRTESGKLERMRLDILSLQAAHDSNRKSVEMYDELLGLHAQKRPAVASYLPDDPDVVTWSNRERELKAERIRVLNERLTLPNLALMRLAGAKLAKHIQELTFAESSILNQLEGGFGIPPGGVFAPS